MKKKISLYVGIVETGFILQIYNIKINIVIMIAKALKSEIKWITFAFIITFILVAIFNSNFLLGSGNTNIDNSFFGLSKTIEMGAFFIFSTFVVFGIKGFFEMYSHKIANAIMIVTGTLLILTIMFLSYQILFRD